VRESGAGDSRDSGHVDVEDAGPFVVAVRTDVTDCSDARVVHDDVEPPNWPTTASMAASTAVASLMSHAEDALAGTVNVSVERSDAGASVAQQGCGRGSYPARAPPVTTATRPWKSFMYGAFH
jgi:hypothetical protein